MAPPATRNQQAVSVQQQHVTWSGPIPPPGALGEYERISPGAAKSILDMAVGQQAHRQSLETQDMRHRTWMEKTGLITGFTLCLVGILVGGFLVYTGKSLTGFGIFLASLGSLVAAAIYKNKKTT